MVIANQPVPVESDIRPGFWSDENNITIQVVINFSVNALNKYGLIYIQVLERSHNSGKIFLVVLSFALRIVGQCL